MTLLRLLFHNPSNRCINEAVADGVAARGATGDFRFPDERRPFLNNETRRFQITLQSAARLELAAFAHRDVALHFSVNGDRFGFDLPTDVRVLTNGQDAIGMNLALYLSV